MNQTLTFRPEISKIKELKLSIPYFSRNMNTNFVVVKRDDHKQELLIGINGKLKTVSFLFFNKAYLKTGIIED